MAKWIEFRLDEVASRAPGKKTRVWNIYAKADESVWLGQVKWFGRWRKYGFSPIPDVMVETYFEPDCLRDIADFCEEQTKAFWAEKRKARSAA